MSSIKENTDSCLSSCSCSSSLFTQNTNNQFDSNGDNVKLLSFSKFSPMIDNSDPDATVSIEMYHELFKRCELYEMQLNSALNEISRLQKKLKRNSSEYKIVSRNEYEALKLQLKAFRHDFKLEQNEKMNLRIQYEKKLRDLQKATSALSISNNSDTSKNDSSISGTTSRDEEKSGNSSSSNSNEASSYDKFNSIVSDFC